MAVSLKGIFKTLNFKKDKIILDCFKQWTDIPSSAIHLHIISAKDDSVSFFKYFVIGPLVAFMVVVGSSSSAVLCS